MRITNSMMVGNLLRNISKNTFKMDHLNDQLSTGKRINKPSDDPVAVLRSMQLNNILKENEQYIENIGQALDWLECTDMALDKVTQTIHRARELTLHGATDTLDQSQRNILCDEVAQLAEHLVEIANATIGGRYVFSGFQTTSKAYTAYNQPYQGDTQKLAVEIGQGVTVKYNVTGNEVFDGAFQALQQIMADLTSGNTNNLSSPTLIQVDQVLDNLLTTRSELGAKVKRLELSKNRFEENEVKHTQLLSEIEDVDIAQTIMNLRMQENVYRASLASGSRIIQPSLVDFIK